MKPVVEVKNLCVKYPASNSLILQDVSFRMEEKSLAMVIGPNGAGKTTLLKAILGFLSPLRGDITIMGKKPQEAREYMSYVPQRFQLDRSFPITVKEFLLLSFPALDSPHWHTIISHVEIGSLLGLPLGNLSGGELQRVLVARAMLKKPRLLLLDEPVSGIDLEGKKNFYELVNHMKTAHGISIIMVSHQLDVVLKFADRVICLNRCLLCDGSPEEIMNQATFRELFGKESILYGHRI